MSWWSRVLIEVILDEAVGDDEFVPAEGLLFAVVRVSAC